MRRGIRARLESLEQDVGPRYGTMTLGDGSEIKYRVPQDSLDAVCVAIDAIDEEEPPTHFLLDAALHKGAQGDLARLLRAISGIKP